MTLLEAIQEYWSRCPTWQQVTGSDGKEEAAEYICIGEGSYDAISQPGEGEEDEEEIIQVLTRPQFVIGAPTASVRRYRHNHPVGALPCVYELGTAEYNGANYAEFYDTLDTITGEFLQEILQAEGGSPLVFTVAVNKIYQGSQEDIAVKGRYYSADLTMEFGASI